MPETVARLERIKKAEVAALRAEIERLRAFVDFVNLWTWRDSNLDDTERLSMIKHHPTAKQRREALNEQKGSQG